MQTEEGMAIRKKSDDVRINEKIRSGKVRLISSDDGEQLGILSLEDALNQAKDAGIGFG